MKEWLKATSPKDVAAFYGPKYRSRGYEAFHAGHAARDEVLKLLEHFAGQLNPKHSFLDAGCGNGEFMDFISRQRKIHTFGIDVTPEAIHLASMLLAERGSAFECDIELAWTNFSEAFNYVTCLGAIEHTMNPKNAHRSLMACLRPGGTLLITVPLEFEGCLNGIQSEPNQYTNERFGTLDEWREIFGCKEDGFTILATGDAALIYSKEE